MPATAACPEPLIADAPAASFNTGNPVRLTAAALARMCESARKPFEGAVGHFVGYAPKSSRLVDVAFGGSIGTERWHVNLIEHVSDANVAVPPKGAE